MESVNYILPAWGGPRRSSSFIPNYLPGHIASLNNLKHSLNQVTLVYTTSTEQKSSFFEYIEKLKNTKTKFNLDIIERQNIGLSYGSFAAAFEKYGEDFEYYIFAEDDYVFLIDDRK